MQPILFLIVQNFGSILVLGLVLVQIFFAGIKISIRIRITYNPILEKGLSNPQY